MTTGGQRRPAASALHGYKHDHYGKATSAGSTRRWRDDRCRRPRPKSRRWTRKAYRDRTVDWCRV